MLMVQFGLFAFCVLFMKNNQNSLLQNNTHLTVLWADRFVQLYYISLYSLKQEL